MPETLTTRAELLAAKAEELPCFSGLKLLHVRRCIIEALSRIGHNGIFEQYTKHDISHIDRMLASLDWLIPESTWARLTSTDALLLVLSIYLHDLGMLVTEGEYGHRHTSGWQDYVQALYAASDGEDYRAKVMGLGKEAGDRFLYQEYVRAHHGERIRAWITGTVAPRLGHGDSAMLEVSRFLDPLPMLFREDLGLVCESHHRSDLGDATRYVISRAYGALDAESGNVQYAALLLRAADLLHITTDRTPSVTFRLISPTDPVSQEEWAKQMAVTAIRSKPALDAEGNVDSNAPRDTIEVFAQFTDEQGFFGLTAYLAYARRELRQTFDWANDSLRRNGSRYEFPWRNIDDSQVLTTGFLRNTFEFSLDTKRVLDLLTGHTLYNNTSVVVRELVQNSLDAIRVQALGEPTSFDGTIKVSWDSQLRRLMIADNGTGMSQAVIERHLLRVGSSRYQDPEFQRQHPEFSPISRFGIGVLSTFMVADAVTITTVHPEEPQGRQLSLRSVHGRYLIRLFDREDDLGSSIGAHGTIVTLDLRPSASLGDLEQILEKWVVVPGCNVSLTVDEGGPVTIGFETIGDALRSRVEQDGRTVSENRAQPRDGDIRIVETCDDGLDLAFATRWSSHFQEWSFLKVPERTSSSRDSAGPLGTCVEGVRVEDDTPGYRGAGIYAMANAYGPAAPRTDVARSGLEQTTERIELLQAAYNSYAGFVASETAELRNRGFSLTWSAQEARILSAPLTAALCREPQLLNRAIAKIPSVVVDNGSERRLITPAEVEAMPVFWTVESSFFRAAETLLRETLSSTSVASLTDSLGLASGIPSAPLVTSVADYASATPMQNREVSRIVLRPAERRVDLAWETHATTPRWIRLDRFPDMRNVEEYDLDVELLLHHHATRRGGNILVARGDDVEIEGRSNETAVKSSGFVFILPGSTLAKYLIDVVEQLESDGGDGRNDVMRYLAWCVDNFCLRPGGPPTSNRGELLELLERAGREYRAPEFASYVSCEDLADAISTDPIVTFDAWAWERTGGASD
jgi:molecular chaperone HtpG